MRRACRPHWWPPCTRTALRSGRLATASSACQTKTGYQQCKARRGTVWGSASLRGPGKKMDRGDGRVRRTSKRVGAGRAVRDGRAAEGRGVRCVRRRAQCSPPRVTAFGKAVRWAWQGNEAASTSLVVHATAVVRVREGAFLATPTSNRHVSASRHGRALHCVVLCTKAVVCFGSHGHQGRHAA